jgi:hypothetical protein
MDFSLNKQSRFFGAVAFSGLVLAFGFSTHVFAADFSLNSDLQIMNQTFDAAQGEEVQLARVTTDMATGHSDFKMAVDGDRSIVAMRYYLDNGTKAEFTVAQILAGVVMVKASGHDVLKLKGENFDAVHGGHLILTYLNNGVTNSYSNFPIDLVKTGDHWGLQVNDQTGHREFTTMFFKGKKFFGKWVGIDSITVK